MRTIGRFAGPRLPLSDKKPRMPLRARRRRVRALAAFAVFALAGGAAYAVSYASYLPRFTVGELRVTGATTVPQALVKDYAETQLYDGSYRFLSPQNIFLYNPARLAREIAGFFPRIRSVQVTRDSMFATAVTVAVSERQPYALWCLDASRASCYQMDSDGFIFADAGGAASSAPASPSGYVFFGGLDASAQNPIGHSFSAAHLPSILALLQLLAQSSLAPTGAAVVNGQDFIVPLAAGYYLKASFGEDPRQLVSNLQLVLSSDTLAGKEDQLEYVDLRFGDKVYYKLRGQDQTSTQ